MNDPKEGQVHVEFEDRGQDILKFMIENDQVIDCNLQGWVWNGTPVLNADSVQVGELLQIRDRAGDFAVMSYKVVKVTRGPVREALHGS